MKKAILLLVVLGIATVTTRQQPNKPVNKNAVRTSNISEENKKLVDSLKDYRKKFDEEKSKTVTFNTILKKKVLMLKKQDSITTRTGQ